MKPTCGLSMVCHPAACAIRVSDRCITVAVEWGATFDCLLDKGYTLKRVSSQSLRAEGAMAMKLSNATDSTIMRVGWWTSLMYLTYSDWCSLCRSCLKNVTGVHNSKRRIILLSGWIIISKMDTTRMTTTHTQHTSMHRERRRDWADTSATKGGRHHCNEGTGAITMRLKMPA